MVEPKLLQALKAEQHALAIEALKKPSDKTEFEYGQRCGQMAGLERALQIMLNLLDEERKADDGL